MTCVTPASVSVMAGAEPLYGTSSMFTPAARLKRTPATDGAVPGPADA